VEYLSPIRLVIEHALKYLLRLRRRAEELDHLLDLVGDDRVEDH